MSRPPVSSDRNWEPTPPNEATTVAAGSQESFWVRDADDPATDGRFKTAGEAYLPHGMYAIGMERVAYTLGAHLELPIPPVYLDEVGGVHGCVMLRAGGPNAIALEWAEGGRSPLMAHNVVNRDIWPLAVAFDTWIANVDRTGKNIMLDPVPPEKRPIQAVESTSWLVDHEKSGLWWPVKIDRDAGLEVERVNVGNGDMTEEGNGFLRGFMPPAYRDAFARLTEEEREPYLAIVRAVPDDLIVAAVEEVPADYMSNVAKRLTIDFLIARRDRVDTLSRDAFPPPTP